MKFLKAFLFEANDIDSEKFAKIMMREVGAEPLPTAKFSAEVTPDTMMHIIPKRTHMAINREFITVYLVGNDENELNFLSLEVSFALGEDVENFGVSDTIDLVKYLQLRTLERNSALGSPQLNMLARTDSTLFMCFQNNDAIEIRGLVGFQEFFDSCMVGYTLSQVNVRHSSTSYCVSEDNVTHSDRVESHEAHLKFMCGDARTLQLKNEAGVVNQLTVDFIEGIIIQGQAEAHHMDAQTFVNAKVVSPNINVPYLAAQLINVMNLGTELSVNISSPLDVPEIPYQYKYHVVYGS